MTATATAAARVPRRRTRRLATAVVVLGVLALAVLGLVRATGGGTPSLHDRVDAVAATIKCPTCGGLSVKDSTSVFANGARQVIEQQLRAGRTPDQVRTYFVDRYGEQVLLSPDPASSGLLAWVLPAVAVPVAGLGVWRWTRRSRGRIPDEADDDARAALAAYRDGDLEPDDSPAGDALQAALAARVAAEEDDAADGPVARLADARLGAAYRRYRARELTRAPVAELPDGAGARRPGRTVPRRLVLAGSAALVVAAAGAGVASSIHGRAPGEEVTGRAAAVSTSAAASAGSTAALPSPPPGYSGGMPQTAEQWVALGRAYGSNQQFAQAVAAYDMALRLQPGADDVVLLRADALVRSGQAATALPDLQKLGTRYPDNPDVLLILGLAQNRTGAHEWSATLRRFLQLAPDSPAAPGVRHLLGDQ